MSLLLEFLKKKLQQLTSDDTLGGSNLDIVDEIQIEVYDADGNLKQTIRLGSTAYDKGNGNNSDVQA